jgi:hypothetical protein
MFIIYLVVINNTGSVLPRKLNHVKSCCVTLKRPVDRIVSQNENENYNGHR